MKNPFLFFVLSLFSICLHAQTTISSSVAITQTEIDSYSWPVIINGGTISSPVVLTLAENISLANSDQYFVIESDYVTFNGDNKTVTIDNVTDYPGLLQNGSSNGDGHSNINVNNTRMHSSNSPLASYGGWIGQSYFGSNTANVIISNCSSDGDITSLAGGITGSFSSCTVINSHSSGELIYGSGGIFGAFSGGAAINCYSTGNSTGEISGGIFGYGSSGNASDCYSTGIIGNFGGGIFGYSSTGSAIRCYSTGNINYYGGGIGGLEYYGSVENCYSTGSIGVNAGGITGGNNFGSVLNCYSTGIIDPDGGGISGTNNAGTITNSFAGGNGTWSDLAAIDILTGVDGSTWTDIDRGLYNTPFKLTSFNANLYSPATESIPSNALINSPAGNLNTGSYSIVNINDTYPSSYPSVTIDNSSGMISFTNSGIGTFTTKILYTDNSDGSYQISDYTLNVLSTLPLTWRSFTVTPRGNAAWLQWSTASEQNTHDFELQHSINGSSWTAIGTVMAARNSTAISNYSYLHADPVTGNNYYRVKQTDLDGKYSYSAIRQLQIILTSKSFTVLNTVVSNGVLQVEVKAQALLYLYSNDGKLFWQREFTAGLQTIDLSNVSKGIYFLKGKDAVEKIVVQ